MLKFLRNKRNQKKIYIVLAIAVIPPFLMWGVSTSQKDAKVPSTLGVIDNRNVSLREYLNSYKAVQHEMTLMYGQKAKESASMINYKGEAWDRLLLLYHAKQEKINTTDTEVVQWLMNQTIFQSHGQFDDNLYKLYVNNYLRSNARDFEEEVRDLLTIQKVVDKLKSNIALTDAELKSLYDQENSQRDIAYGVLSWESEKNNVQVTDEDIRNIYPLVKDKLTDPERVKISYLLVPKQNVESLKALFDEKGATLEALSKKYSLPIKETGYFSKNEAVPEIGLSKDILFASFSLPLNQESDWFSLDGGSYKIKVTDKKAERPLSLDEAKEELKKIMLKQKAIQSAITKLDEAKKKMQGNGFEQTLKDLGIEIKHLEKYKKGDTIPEIGKSETAEKIITGLKQGELSQAFPAPNGASIVKVVKNSAGDDQKFEAEKEEFKKKILQEKASEGMRDLMGKLRNKLKIDLETMKKLFASEEKPAVNP